MEKLMKTPFCQLITKWQEGKMNSTEEFVSYYSEFKEEVVFLVNNLEEEETPVYLTFSYTEFILRSYYDKISKSVGEKNVVLSKYLEAAIYIVEMAKKLVTIQLKNCMESNKKKISNGKKIKLQWTGKAVELVELVYALWVSRSINNGEFDIKSTLEMLGELIGVDTKNCYHLYWDMRNRTKSRTLFLDKLKEMLESKMDRDDELKEERTSIR